MGAKSQVDAGAEQAVRLLATPLSPRRTWRRPAADPAEAVRRYREATADPSDPGTVGDCGAEVLQHAWLVSLARAEQFGRLTPADLETVRRAAEQDETRLTGAWYQYLEFFRRAVSDAYGIPA